MLLPQPGNQKTERLAVSNRTMQTYNINRPNPKELKQAGDKERYRLRMAMNLGV
jgi:hypothetical protein